MEILYLLLIILTIQYFTENKVNSEILQLINSHMPNFWVDCSVVAIGICNKDGVYLYVPDLVSGEEVFMLKK